MNNRIKFLILLAILIIVGRNGFAQRIIADDVILQSSNLYASMYPRFDKKGKACAVLLLQSTLPNLRFYGDIVGDVERKQSTYYIYLKPGTNKLKVRAGEDSEVDIRFDKVQPKYTYEVRISETVDIGRVSLTSDPSGASVKLVSSEKSIDLGRTPIKGEMKILAGTYQLIISKPGYLEITKKITIKPNLTTNLGTIKLKNIIKL